MLPYAMFDIERSAEEARRADKLAAIYHRGQAQAWNGREVLASLVEAHGGIRMDPDCRRALGRVFSMILWGELAAWKVAAQLADRLEPLEAKMAATSQAHDEARHFYVMHDYLRALEGVPGRPDRDTEALLALILRTDSLCEKVFGMQLMVESIALTLFHMVRKLGPDPVLRDLLAYYERDEARHVGLGIQYLPELMKRMSLPERVALVLFEVRAANHMLRGLKAIQADLECLGISAREVFEDGMARQQQAGQLLLREIGLETTAGREAIGRGVNAVAEVVFPRDQALPLRRRLGRAARALRRPLPRGSTAAEIAA